MKCLLPSILLSGFFQAGFYAVDDGIGRNGCAGNRIHISRIGFHNAGGNLFHRHIAQPCRFRVLRRSYRCDFSTFNRDLYRHIAIVAGCGRCVCAILVSGSAVTAIAAAAGPKLVSAIQRNSGLPY